MKLQKVTVLFMMANAIEKVLNHDFLLVLKWKNGKR